MPNKSLYLTTKDHSVSGESFQLIYDADLDMLKTFPQPEEDKLADYYESEDYISHTDAKRNLFEKAYHIVRARSLKRKLKLINSFSSETKTLLDVGCGTGDFLKVAKEDGWKVFGIEPNLEARTISNNKTNQSVYDIEHLEKFEASSYDVITLWHVLEHLPKLDWHLTLFEKLLKPNGRLIIAVPNYKSHDANHYKQFWAAYDVPRHLWHFSKTSISKLGEKQNMDVQNIHPMIFDAFYVSLLSEKYKRGKMAFLNAFYRGLVSNWKAKRSGEYSSLIYCLKKSK